MSSDPELEPEYFATLGLFIHNWAYHEEALDACIAVIYQKVGKPKKIRRLPISLEAKITFLRTAHEQLDELAPYKEVGIDIADRAEEMREKRHFLIHGTPNYTDPNEIEMMRLRTEKHIHRITKMLTSVREIRQFAGTTLTLTHDTAIHCNNLIEAFAYRD